MTEQQRLSLVPLIAIGLVGGLLSGLFGIGGGVVIVPALVLVLVMPQRLAAGTSVAAILPAAVVGAISYAVQGNVDWAAGILLAIGIVVGSQVGSLLLAKLSLGFLQWLFLGFLLVVIVSLWFVVPQRDSEISITVLTGAMLALTGFLTGILSGLIGVGGGIIVVPVLMFFFGANDLVAKGTSLVMMIPGSISGTLANWRRKKRRPARGGRGGPCRQRRLPSRFDRCRPARALDVQHPVLGLPGPHLHPDAGAAHSSQEELGHTTTRCGQPRREAHSAFVVITG